MLVKLVEIYKPQGDRAHLDELYVNPSSVTSIRSERGSVIQEAYQLGIDQNAGFSQIVVNEGGTQRIATVVGTPAEIREKLNKRQLLRD